MNYKELVNLLRIVEDSNFVNCEIDFEDTYLNLSKQNTNKIYKEKKPVKTKEMDLSLVNDDDSADGSAEQLNYPTTIFPKEQEVVTGCIVKSPIVGTFYNSNAPGSPAFVKLGDIVKKGDILCIIEAMKVMNEVTSKYDGKVLEILVENEGIVEYNQPLFKIDENYKN